MSRRRYLMATQGGQPSVEAYHTGGGYRIRFAETLKIDLSLCKPYKRNHDRGDPTKHYENVLRGDQSGRFSF